MSGADHLLADGTPAYSKGRSMWSTLQTNWVLHPHLHTMFYSSAPNISSDKAHPVAEVVNAVFETGSMMMKCEDVTVAAVIIKTSYIIQFVTCR